MRCEIVLEGFCFFFKKTPILRKELFRSAVVAVVLRLLALTESRSDVADVFVVELAAQSVVFVVVVVALASSTAAQSNR